MAIILEENKKPFNLFTFIAVLMIVLIIGLAGYFLFFALPPAIEVIIPPPLKTSVEITQVQFDPAIVINSQTFKSLRTYGGLPTAGLLGRNNPFISY